MTNISVTVNRKYSKSSSFYLNTKKDFFNDNEKLLKQSLSLNRLYTAQPERKLCKLCKSRLPDRVDFTSHGIDYVFCSDCSHLNGKFEDTKSFIEKLYIADGGSEYASSYLDKDFAKRTTDIYIPKVDFLISSMRDNQCDVLDVGCGAGYFVYGALLRNLRATGLDVSKTMVDFGNVQISHLKNQSPLIYESEKSFYDTIVNSRVNVISAIGVIEHLRDPHKFFEAFTKSRAQYLYYSVPMFSFSVILENIFTDVFPRQLSGGHTHLLTEKSYKRMNEIIRVKPIAEWRFGTDVMDLYRSVVTKLKRNQTSQAMIDYLHDGFGKKIDDIQSILDRNHFCSEIHCVALKL